MKVKYSQKIKNQELFQGSEKKDDYFEGWYFKHTDQSLKYVVSFIVGISKTKSDSHAFIQVIDNIKNKSCYVRYDIDDFTYNKNPFYVKIKENYFSLNKIYVNIKSDIKIEADISYSNLTPISKNIYSPNIMGPFAYLTFMECNHAVISLKHKLSGYIKIYNKKITFDDGLGYIEKDYGSSFPEKYFWLQSNSLENKKDASIFLSIAKVPIKKKTITGIISILQIGDKQYRFATYNLTKIKRFIHKKIGKNEYYFITLKKQNYELEIILEQRNKTKLTAPKNGLMKNTVYESLNSIAKVKLVHDNKDILYETFSPCSCEIYGYDKKIN